jgi:pimeloyl-ACP methyl ester carboxylesterase
MSNRKKIVFFICGSVFLILLVGPFLIPVPELTGTVDPQELAGPGSRFTQLGKIDIHYLQEGTGKPAFILLHGFASSTFTWREVMQPLSEVGQVAAYDRPAFGLTERPMEWEGENPYSSEYQPKLLISLMDHLKIERAILVGNSAGGAVAVQTALLYPERVEALVLVSPAIDQGGSPGWARFIFHLPQMNRIGPLLARSLQARGAEFAASAWHDPSKVTDEVWAGYSLPLQAHDWDRALWEFTRSSRSLGLQERLGELDLPVLVISGDDDKIVPFEYSERAAGEIRGAELVEIADCGHVPHEECPEAFLDAVRKFLDVHR